jgi:hypothetical protein
LAGFRIDVPPNADRAPTGKVGLSAVVSHNPLVTGTEESLPVNITGSPEVHTFCKSAALLLISTTGRALIITFTRVGFTSPSQPFAVCVTLKEYILGVAVLIPSAPAICAAVGALTLSKSTVGSPTLYHRIITPPGTDITRSAGGTVVATQYSRSKFPTG